MSELIENQMILKEKMKKEMVIEEELHKTIDSSSSIEDYHDITKLNNILNKIPTASPFMQNFELLKFISNGSVGTFYEGRSKKGSHLKVGMKFILFNSKKDKKDKKILMEKNKEMLLLKKLKHQKIINLYGNYKLDDYNSCAILELAKYGDLDNFQRSILKRKYFAETIINYFTKQILDGLNYLHNQNKILHMDIKQDNILVDANLNAKITDLSISLCYKNLKENEKIKLPFAGTSKYISPEILTRKKINVKDISKIDMYSLGVTLYYVAYGTYPFGLKTIKRESDESGETGDFYERITNKIRDEELTFPSDIESSPMFKDFLKGLLEKDIKKRFDINKALKHEWIKGADFIFEEKEKVENLEKFLISILTDAIPQFNEYVWKKEEKK